MSFNMYVPTRFVFGNGRLSELSQYKMPGKKAMIVTTNGTSVFKNGAYDNTADVIKTAYGFGSTAWKNTFFKG